MTEQKPTKGKKVRVYLVRNTNINKGIFVTDEENGILNFNAPEGSPCYAFVVDTGSKSYRSLKQLIVPGNIVGIRPLQELCYTRAIKKDSEGRFKPEIADLEVMKATTLPKERYDNFQEAHLEKVREAHSVATQIARLQHEVKRLDGVRRELFDHLEGEGSIESLLISSLSWS